MTASSYQLTLANASSISQSPLESLPPTPPSSIGENYALSYFVSKLRDVVTLSDDSDDDHLAERILQIDFDEESHGSEALARKRRMTSGKDTNLDDALRFAGWTNVNPQDDKWEAPGDASQDLKAMVVALQKMG